MPTVAFDMIGTFFSLDRVRRALKGVGAPPVTVELWFAQALRDFFGWSHAGGYAPFQEFIRPALPRALTAVGVEADEADQQRVMEALAQLDPVEGAGEACEVLRRSGFRLLTVTNGSEQFTRSLLERAGLADRFHAMVSTDDVEVTKPAPQIYEAARRHAEGDLWLVAAHGWDVAGAHRAGLRTAWVSGAEQLYLDVLPEPEVTAATLVEAAEAIVARTG